MDTYNIYSDIKLRTNGEVFIGVVGPVRTGKSTFIRNFAKEFLLPKITDEALYNQTMDELPQGGDGRLVMTTEPKFVPRNAVTIKPFDDISLKVRMIDCVGFLVDGASVSNGSEDRLVKTPWFSKDIPFKDAAEFGTKKVIDEHSTIAVVVTCDGSFLDIPPTSYEEAENKTISALTNSGKPYIVIINSKNPEANAAKEKEKQVKERFSCHTMRLNCEKISERDVSDIFSLFIKAFPVSNYIFDYPEWIDELPKDNPVRKNILEKAREIVKAVSTYDEIDNVKNTENCEYIESIFHEAYDMINGEIRYHIYPKENTIFNVLSSASNLSIDDFSKLMGYLKEYSKNNKQIRNYIEAIDEVKSKGYSVISPNRDEIIICEPTLIKNNNRYGIKIKADSPTYHIIKVNIETEIAPIVGNEDQAKDLIKYIDDNTKNGDVWQTSIFGKTVEQLVEDGINTKLRMMNDDCQKSLMDAMNKVVNENSGGIICLII